MKWTELYTEDIYARNDEENPQRVYPIIKKIRIYEKHRNTTTFMECVSIYSKIEKTNFGGK